jgi:hypothetical protein
MGERIQSVIRRMSIALLPLPGLLAVISCGGSDVQAPTAGSIEITTATNGPEPDADGYSITIDHGTATAIGVSATMQHDNLEGGSHSVELGGIAANCAVAGENPRTVSVSVGETARIIFELTCSATTGRLQVTSATSGPSADPDGYVITLDGTDRGTLGGSGAVTIEGLAAGDHVIGLSGVAGNCEVQAENPRSVTVTAGASATVAFAITCAAPPPVTGTLRITTSTTGADLDADGYAVALDGGTSQPIGTTATATLANVTPGTRLVRLSRLAGNCRVQGTNPRSVTVSGGATADVSFTITCTATTGSLIITTATTGSSPDPDGYTVRIDGGTGQAIGVSATITVPGIAVGTHSVALASLAAGCAVQGDNPRSVSVLPGAGAAVAFSLSCSPPGLTRWTPMASGTTNDLRDISGSSATNIFVVDWVGVIRHYDGVSWTPQSAPANLSQVWANSVTDAFATGNTSDGIPVLLHYDGQQWSIVFSPPVPPGLEDHSFFWTGIWGTGADVFAVGNWSRNPDDENTPPGYLVHYDGSVWSSELCCGDLAPGLELTGVWGSSKEDVYVIGFRWGSPSMEGDPVSVFMRKNGDVWSEFGLIETTFHEIWGSSASDVYVTSSAVDTKYQESFWHFNGTDLDSPTPQPAGWDILVGAIWGTAADDIYVVVSAGVIRHFNGTDWKNVYASDPQIQWRAWSDIWGSSSTDVFVVGGNGTILHGTP